MHAMVCETLEPDFFNKGLAFYSLMSKWLMCIQLDFYPSKGEWWTTPSLPKHLKLNPKLSRVPAHVFSDLTKVRRIFNVFAFLSKREPNVVRGCSPRRCTQFVAAPSRMDKRVADEGLLANWEAILGFFIVTMNSPEFAVHIHVRAEMGDAVFDCFLVENAKWDDSSGAFSLYIQVH